MECKWTGSDEHGPGNVLGSEGQEVILNFDPCSQPFRLKLKHQLEGNGRTLIWTAVDANADDEVDPSFVLKTMAVYKDAMELHHEYKVWESLANWQVQNLGRNTASLCAMGLCSVNDPEVSHEFCVLKMEYYKGGDLMDWVAGQQALYTSTFAAEQVPSSFLTLMLPFCIEVFSTVSFFHDTGSVAGDLKPENFVFDGQPLSPQPFQKVHLIAIDFGSFTHPQVACGDDGKQRSIDCTPEYLAPELVPDLRKFQPLMFSREADKWALGCILFLMLTGLEPFRVNGVRQSQKYGTLYDQFTLTAETRYSDNGWERLKKLPRACQCLVFDLLQVAQSMRCGELAVDDLEEEFGKNRDNGEASPPMPVQEFNAKVDTISRELKACLAFS